MTLSLPENTTGNITNESVSIGSILSGAVRVARFPMLLTDPRQPENPIVFANQAFSDLTGYDSGDVLGRNCRFLQGPETDRSSVEKLKIAINEGQDVSTPILNYRKDGSSFWNLLHLSPVYSASGDLLYFFSCQIDVSAWHDSDNLLAQAQKLQNLSPPTPRNRGGKQLSPASAGSNIAALRRWREMERFACFAESNLARREVAFAGGMMPPALEVERLLAAELRDAAVRARNEAFNMLDENKIRDH